MRRRLGTGQVWFWLCGIGVYTLLSHVCGCALRSSLPGDVRERVGGYQRSQPLPWESLPVVDPVDRAAPVRPSEVFSAAEVTNTLGNSVPLQYRRVTMVEVARAGNGSLVADLLEVETQAAWVAGQCDTNQCVRWSLEEDVLRLRAEEERQRNAARALEIFWGLAEAERVRYWLMESASVLDQALQEVQRLRGQGLVSGEQEVLLRIERKELDLQLSAAEQMIIQLNHQLSGAMQLALPPEGRLWPEVTWQLKAEVPDLERCLERALASRADVRLLELLRERLSADTVAAVRQALAVQISSLGASPRLAHVLRRWLECACADAEAAVRAVQLDWLWEEYRQQVVAEVQQKHQALKVALVEAAIADELRDLRAQHRDDMRIGRRASRVSIEQWVRAELEWLKAESELARKIGRAKRSELELHAACGDVVSHVSGE